MKLSAFLEDLVRFASATEIKDAVDEHTGSRPPTRELALAIIKRLLTGGKRDVVVALLSEVYAENLRAWAAELGHPGQNKDRAISTIFGHYFVDAGEDEEEEEDEDEDDELDVEAFVEDLADFAGAEEIKDAAEAITPRRPPTKERGLAAITRHLRRSPVDADEALGALYASTLKAWCVDLELGYSDKDAAVESLVDYYRSALEDDDAFEDLFIIDDLAAFASATEVRNAASLLTGHRPSTKTEALDYLEEHLSDHPTATEQLFLQLSAGTLRDWCDAYDLGYTNKSDAVRALVELYEAEDGGDDEEGPVTSSKEDFFAELAFAPEGRAPRDYQIEATKTAAQRLKPGQLVQVQIATGGGKTLVGNDVVARHVAEGRNVLWITKDWTLLKQAAIDFAQRYGKVEELGRIGGSNTELKHLPDVSGRLRYTTLQTLARRRAGALKQFKPSLVVWDECHWGEDGKAGRTIVKMLRDRQIPALGLTATPRDGNFEVVYRKSFAELVGEGHLARPVLQGEVKTNITWSPGLNAFNDFDTASLKKLAFNRTRNKKIVEHWIANAATYGKTIVFACFIEHAEALAKLFGQSGIAVRVVHSQRPREENAQALAAFKDGRIAVIINVAKLTHGVDVPDARTVMMCRPTASDILFAQMVGRASRRAPGKDTFNIVEFTDNIAKHGEHLYSAKSFYTGAGFGDVESRRGPTGPRPAVRSRPGFDPRGVGTWIPDTDVVPELRGCWYRQDQSFGIELELTADHFSDDMSERLWLETAELLRSRLAGALGDRVATRPLTTYVGFGGEKDYTLWHVERDNSAGWEVTSPILKNAEGFAEAAMACAAIEQAAKEANLKVNWRTGFHLHLGWRSDDGTLPSIEATKRLLLLTRVFEPALATLVAPSRIAGFDGARYDVTEANIYARPISTIFTASAIKRLSSHEQLARKVEEHDNRYLTVNLQPLGKLGTVEVRLHSGTMDASKVLLWVSLWQQILWAAEHRTVVAEVPDTSVIVPDGDIVALAREYLPDARQPQQQKLLERLHNRRLELRDIWYRHSELKPWATFASGWAPPK